MQTENGAPQGAASTTGPVEFRRRRIVLLLALAGIAGLACVGSRETTSRAPRVSASAAKVTTVDVHSPKASTTTSHVDQDVRTEPSRGEERASAQESKEPLQRYDPEEEARVRKRLSAIAFLPQRLMSNPPPGLAPARQLYDQTRAKLRSGRWHEQQRVRCPNPDGFWDDLAIATDEAGRVRVYTVLSGGDDSAGEVRYWFDEQGRQRMMLVLRADVSGGEEEHVVLLDGEGQVVGCDRRIVHEGDYPTLDLCGADPIETPAIDPAVRGVSRHRDAPAKRVLNELRDSLLQVSPLAEWTACPTE
jgi:hypothetical protein